MIDLTLTQFEYDVILAEEPVNIDGFIVQLSEAQIDDMFEAGSVETTCQETGEELRIFPPEALTMLFSPDE